jgi:hypothetical protein
VCFPTDTVEVGILGGKRCDVDFGYGFGLEAGGWEGEEREKGEELDEHFGGSSGGKPSGVVVVGGDVEEFVRNE